MYSLARISEFAGTKLQGDGSEEKDWQLLIDSRTITDPDTSIFFALKTKFNDGHHYISELVEKGVRTFVVNEGFRTSSYPGCNFLFAKDVRKAMQQLVAKHREHFDIPVIGITGSNGKTIVKEWLVQLLEPKKKVCFSPKSYNSQIGVPLSVWQLNASHELGIFEAGISTTGEMEALEAVIQPSIGVLTHLGPAHNEGFTNFEQKISEKLKLFRNCKVVIMKHDPAISRQIQGHVLSFGFNDSGADMNIVRRETSASGTAFTAEYKNRELYFDIPFTDDASIENACLCCLCTLYLDGFDAPAFKELHPVSMRLELKKGINNCLLINDSYSNDLHALSSALSFLQQQNIHERTTVILSDIEQSGLRIEELWKQVQRMLEEKHVSRLIAIGPGFSQFAKQDKVYGFDTLFFKDTKDFLESFYQVSFHNETILIKGARSYHFERITGRLEQLTHGTVLEINLSAASRNLDTIKNRLEPGIKVMAMVKAFAYGSGSYEMARLIEHKVDYLAVAYTDEGVALRQNGIRIPIMVMNADEDALEQLIRHQLEPVVFSMNQLKMITSQLELHHLRVHIEIDTGMHRLGFNEEDVTGLCDYLKAVPRIHVSSVFSHLSASDEPKYDDFTALQFSRFKNAAARMEELLGYSFLKHISNTAATLRFRRDGLDMVRLGIGLYGIDPTNTFEGLLEPVFTLKTSISQIKTIAANESVGYSRKAISDHPRQIAILALGYADGLNRALSNGKGSFEINGHHAPIVGNICMDMCMVDVTGLQCREGDEAVLFGKNSPIQDVAERLGTIPYEVLTSISQRVKRVYVSE